MNGNDIIIVMLESGQTGTPAAIAATRSDEIQNQCELQEVSGPNTGEWKQFIPGQKNWGFTVNSLVTAITNLPELLMVGKTYTITIKGRSGTTALTGTAICTEAKFTGTKGNLCNGGFSFIGSGALTQTTLSS